MEYIIYSNFTRFQASKTVLSKLFFVATKILAENRQKSFGDPIFFTDFITSIKISIFVTKLW